MCSTIASLAYDAAINHGCQPQFSASQKRKASSMSSSLKAAAGRQPRGNKLPEVIPEFDYTFECKWCLPPPAKVPRLLHDDERVNFSLTQPAKLLSYLPSGETSDESPFGVAKVGVYRTCEKFTAEALKVAHPFDDASTLDDAIKMNIFNLLTKGSEWVAQHRREQLGYYKSRARALSAQEQTIHEGMTPLRAALVQEKKFLLFEEMCNDAGVVDDGILDSQVLGTSLVGVSGSSNLFEAADNVPAMTTEQLMKSSRWSRKMLQGRTTVVNADSAEVANDIWNGALEEVSRGWLQGPFTEAQVVELLGPLFVASPRFGLKQTDKVRAIDDISLVNSSFAAGYRLSLDGVDGIAIMARSMLEAVSADGNVSITLSSGRVLSDMLHSSMSVNMARDLCGRTLDLEAAYKQMLVKESSLWASVLLIEEPGVGKRHFVSQVLPFGASASVYSFNRTARAIHRMGVVLMGLIWSNYYDDYPQLDLVSSGSNAQDTAEELLTLLGWRYSTKEAKRQCMSKSISALGVTFDFSESQSPRARRSSFATNQVV